MEVEMQHTSPFSQPDLSREETKELVTIDLEEAQSREFALQWNVSLSAPVKRRRGDAAAQAKRTPQGEITTAKVIDDVEADVIPTEEVDVSAMERNGSTDAGRKIILENVTGQAKSGQMLALMGASGAGKTSLLDCISLRNRKFTGQVYIDGEPVGQKFYSTTGE